MVNEILRYGCPLATTTGTTAVIRCFRVLQVLSTSPVLFRPYTASGSKVDPLHAPKP